MLTVKLDSRLQTIASMVKQNAVLVDVGTDHAYLPVFLIQNNVIQKAIAADVKQMPLQNAKNTIKEATLENKIQTVLSNGLDSLKIGCGNSIVLAGMGGMLIEEILSRCDWIKSKEIQIIAQPMTHAEHVRSFFLNNDFEITEEKACFCAGHYYCVISAAFSGKNQEYSKGYTYYGKLAENSDENSKEYLKRQYSRLKKRYEGLLGSGKNKEEAAELAEILLDFQNHTEVTK